MSFSKPNLANVDLTNVHVLIDGDEAESITKTITNITELKAIINNEEKTIGYRYTLKLTEFSPIKHIKNTAAHADKNFNIL